jgi:hypothetical protein
VSQVTSPGAAPRFAILLCTHDGSRFLGELLDSLAAQVGPLARVHVHDWASTDATVALLADRRAHWPAGGELRIVRHDDAPGPCRSFLRALREVIESDDGFDWLLFCDQDDIWDAHKLDEFARCIRGNPEVDLVYSDVELVDADGRRTAASYVGPDGRLGMPPAADDPAVMFVNTIPGMAMAVSRRLLLEAAPAWALDTWVMHDWAVMVMAHVLRARAAFIPRALVRYRQHDGNHLGSAERHRLTSFGPGRARTYVRAVRRQYLACAALAATLAGARPLDPLVSGFEVACTVLRGRALRRLHACKVALGYLAFWDRAAVTDDPVNGAPSNPA